MNKKQIIVKVVIVRIFDLSVLTSPTVIKRGNGMGYYHHRQQCGPNNINNQPLKPTESTRHIGTLQTANLECVRVC